MRINHDQNACEDNVAKRKKLIKKFRIISYRRKKTLNRKIENNARRNSSFKKKNNVTMSISKFLEFLKPLNSERNDRVEDRKSFDLI